jgi:hypothetical protein
MTTANQSRRIGGAEDISPVRERYGKSDFMASIVGMFAGLGTLVFLGALLAAGAGEIDFQLNLLTEGGALDEGSILGLVVAALTVFVAMIAGGYAAGRMAVNNGGASGFGAGLWLILLVAIFAALGAWVGAEYNAFNRTDLPNWFAQLDADDLTTMAIVASAVLVGATLVGGYIGGVIGQAHHTRLEAALVATARKEV